jgi:N utilization substance protein A
MIDIKQFLSAIKQIAEEKGIPEQSVLETIEAALAAAYKRDYGKKGQIIHVKLDSQTGTIQVSQVYFVVEGVDEEGYVSGVLPAKLTEDRQELSEGDGRRRQVQQSDIEVRESGEIKVRFNPEKHIVLEEAQKQNSNIQIGDELVLKLEPHTEFGRIAAQTAKQVVIQRLREAEREAVFSEFRGKEGTLVSGVVQRREGNLVFIDLGKTNGLLLPIEQSPVDTYRIGQRFRCVIVRVEETSRGPAIILSRAHPRLVHELFRMEVPEIDSGSVEIKDIVREPGSRAKVAVVSKEEGVDPIGSLVGQKGVRVQTVINELAGEKIDIILWDERPQTYISNALSPAKVITVELVDEAHKIALAEVADDQFSLAIGRRGQNVRLAAKLTGWRIDVRSPKENLTFNEVDTPVEAPQETEQKELS